MARTAMIALGMPGWQEMGILLVIGLLIFGRRLPEVGRSLGKTIAQLRRGFQDFRHQINADEELRDARATVHELKKAVDVPRTLASPTRMVQKMMEDDEPTGEAPQPRSDPAGDPADVPPGPGGVGPKDQPAD